jgi:FdhE protein
MPRIVLVAADATTRRRAAAALAAAHGMFDLDALAACALAGAWDDVRAAARRLDVDEHALVTLLDHAARPTMRAAAAMVRPLLQHVSWSRGSCPACGAPPILAELRGTDGERVLRCGRCASAWRFPRLVCPACGERDHRRLGSLHVEGEAEFRRVDYCDTCRTYVKAVAALDPLDVNALLEEDLRSAVLDFVALERGLRR